MNCSGKHAAMLATCAANEWPVDNYLDAGHPLQQAVVETILDLTGDIEETDLGIDGCGLPIVPVPLINLARAYSRLATADPDTPERAVADAIREHPFLISGSGKDDLRLMQAVPGLMSKAGADGIHAGALPDGSAFAFKIDDGHERARLPLTAAVLTRLGVTATRTSRRSPHNPCSAVAYVWAPYGPYRRCSEPHLHTCENCITAGRV